MEDPNKNFTVAGPSASSYVKVEACEEALRACRGCLATDARLFPLHAHALADAYGQLLGAPVTRTDGLPQHLCSICCCLLQKFTEFRERSKVAQNYLHSIQTQHNECQITTELIRSIDTSHLKRKLKITNIQHIEITPSCIEIDQLPLAEVKRRWTLGFGDTVEECDGNLHQDLVNDGMPAIDDEIQNTEKPKRHKNNLIKTDIKPKQIKTETKTKSNTPKAAAEKAKPTKELLYNEECFKAFEIVRLSKEQQLKEMETRKETASYKWASFKCELCYTGFYAKSKFDKHMSSHDPATGRFECEICRLRYLRKAYLVQHYNYHEYSFVCKHCRHVSRSAKQAKAHYTTHKGLKYTCKHCGKEFDKKKTQLAHVRLKHGTERCAVCGDRFTGAKGLSTHVAIAHRQGTDPSCAGCKLHFHNMDALNKHLDELPDRACDDTVRACQQCGQNFPTLECLRSHAQAHRKTVYKCDKCLKSFKRQRMFEDHLCRRKVQKRALVPAAKLYICEVCGAKQINHCQLKEHMLIHTGEKPHQCMLCPMRFRLAVSLKHHMNKHTGSRPYQCPLCPKAFLSAAGRHAHRLVHTKELRCPCPVCGKMFRTNTYVKIHIKTAHLKEAWPKRDRARGRAHKHTAVSQSDDSE